MIKAFLFFSAILFIYIAVNTRWGGDEKWKGIIQGDGRGYYAYLPAVFIYHDLNYGFYDSVETQKIKWPAYNYRLHHKGRVINKYFSGTAVMEMPFFLMAHGISYLADKPMDGYSKLYFKFIHLSGIFYFVLGLWFMSRYLAALKIKDIYILITLAVITFGTNLFYYGLFESSLSHIYSFALINMFVFYSHQFFKYQNVKLIIPLFAVVGLILLVRPINVLVLLSLPFIAGKWENFVSGVKTLWDSKFQTLIGVVITILLVFLQLIFYKISSGDWIIDSYNDSHGFQFLNAHFFDFLISYKKGLFLYTPVYLVALSGMYFVFKESRYQFFIFFAFLIIVVYVFSSWFNWWYGGSFSSRVMVEYLPFFAFSLAMALQKIPLKPIRKGLLIILLALVVVCQIQTRQYTRTQIHWDSMTKEKYWDVFLKI